MRARARTGRGDPLWRLRRSASVAREIPRPLRALDLTLVALALPFALLVGGVMAIAVFLDSPGPILYRSRRVGRGGESFDMLKFRTMVRDASGPPVSARRDVRYTPLGRSLAQSRLDELPQLWNVLRGDMRLVGPRPELEDFVREFPDEFARILSVPPGLTGPSQVAFASEGKVLALAQEHDRARVYRESILPLKVEIDMAYAASHTVAGDLALLARTLVLPVVRTIRHLDAALGGNGRGRRARRAGAALTFGSVVALLVLVAAASSGHF